MRFAKIVLISLFMILSAIPPVHAVDVLSVEHFFGVMTFAQKVGEGFVNGFVQFNPDHTWHRVAHTDTNRDQVPENVLVERGTYRVLKPEDGDAVLVMTLDTGQEYGRPKNLVFVAGVVESFTLGDFSYKRRKGDDPYFDQKQNEKPLAAALVITSEPAGASIILDGKPQKGLTPLTIQKPTAQEEHTVRAEKSGFLPQTRKITLGVGERVNLNFEMSQGQTRLRIVSRPLTHVAVDGVPKGSTPMDQRDLSPGDHVVTLSLPILGISYEEKVYLTPDKEVKVSHDFLGKLTIDVGRRVTVFDSQDRKIGAAPGDLFEFPVGNHPLVLKDEKGKKKRILVTVKEGETTVFDTAFDDIR